jgi:uncharacterized protein YaaQ
MLPVSEGSVDRVSPTKLLVAIVQIDDVQDLMHRLVERGLGATRIDAAGGFLRKENAVVLIATTDDQVPVAQAVLRETCRTRTATWFPTIDDGTIGLYTEPIEVEVGGAVVFVIPIERVEYLGGVLGAVGAAAVRPSGGG